MIQREIALEAYRHQQKVESGERVVVGVNKFTRDEPELATLDLYKVDTALGVRQREALAQIKSSRDQARVESSLATLREAARGTGNLMLPILEAVKAYASLGEICGVLRNEFGTFQEPVGL